jgi:CubicO group peptidase (beta-lactamase class C family)
MKKIGPSDIKRIRAAAQAVVDDYHLPGIAVGVVSGDDLVYAEGFGYADIEGKKPQDPSRRQRIGSITKTMVGLSTMALVDEGRLSLEDRITDRLPDVTFHGPVETLTVRHLLTHTGGIGEAPMPDQVSDPGPALWSDGPDVPGIPEAYPEGITIEVPPGTKWAYANHGFALMGEIVSRIEGVPIEEVLRRRVLDPLGMTNTDCLDQPHKDLTTGYHRRPTEDERELAQRAGQELPDEETVDGHNIRGKYQYVKGRAAGAVQSTIPDMARYASALLRRADGIVKAETFDAMIAPQYCPDERLTSIGFTFFREPRFGRRAFGHGGGVSGGWNTHIAVLPEEGLALLVHLNLTFDKFHQVDGRILQAVLDASDTPAGVASVDEKVLSAAPGVYEATPGRLTNFRIMTGTGRVQVMAEGGELIMRARRGPWKGGVRMLPVDANDRAFFALDTGDPEPPRVAMKRDEKGAVTGLRFDRLVEMVRNGELEPWA